MITRPFHIEYLDSQSINETRVELNYSTKDASVLKRIETEFTDLMSAIVLIGSHGGFSGDKFNPLDSKLSLKEPNVFEKNETVWTFSHAKIGPGFVLVLLNLVHTMHLKYPHIDKLQISTALINKDHPLVPDVIEFYSPLPYEYLHEVVSTTVVVDIDFLERQDAQAIEFFRDVFDAWYRVASAGGFADEEFVPSKEIVIFIENELQVTSVGLQIVYENVQVGETGFNVLTNILTYFHYTIASLDNVEIA